MTDYTVYTDIDLWRLASNGDAGAEEELIERYGRMVRVCARPYFLAGGDSVLEAVKAASRKKHGPLNDGVSLEYIILSEESQVGPATQPEIFRRTPEEQVLARESEKEFYSTFSRCLSVFETEVLFHFLDGLSYRQIAEAVGRTEKAVDNAVQRIRRKLARQPFLGDISRS